MSFRKSGPTHNQDEIDSDHQATEHCLISLPLRLDGGPMLLTDISTVRDLVSVYKLNVTESHSHWSSARSFVRTWGELTSLESRATDRPLLLLCTAGCTMSYPKDSIGSRIDWLLDCSDWPSFPTHRLQ